MLDINSDFINLFEKQLKNGNVKYIDKKSFTFSKKIYNSLNNKPIINVTTNGFINMSWKIFSCIITYDEAIINTKNKKSYCLLPFDIDEYPFDCITILKELLGEKYHYDHIV